ncbi:MAG: hypothetical protein FP825_12720 [Hyphomonas sp.]|nr:hypothetical protein [Hyphomonas sp.]MBU3922102.1 SEC-C domain-containing protein [Alphaproteobacteria bacterium]MBU4063708.1 SEC-C domain-containing protein [Alphaproteobacteria bacterium]MBU4164331.1 SEC-C domain-containing protein [Alphaproteobacteria bacterium]MBU4567977.1 SEC-C domain-containing protein [Alphaproteobacteria bacterium]
MSWHARPDHSTNFRPFEVTSKRRKGFNSETRVKRGVRFVHGDKELVEKLGRKDLCPCGSGQRFQQVLPQFRPLSMAPIAVRIPANRCPSAGDHAAPEPG